MARQLASIQKIKAISTIEGADAIEKIEVLGWELVAKKGDFQIGDLCVFIEIDSILPDRPEFEFMRPRKFRVRTIKLRSQISQGIAFPLSILPVGIIPIIEGFDVTEVLGITKFDPEQESIIIEKDPEFNDKNKLARAYKKYKYFTIKFLKKLFGISIKTMKDDYPSYLPKTDENRVQNSQRGLEIHQGKKAYISEKMEGSSTGFIIIKSKGSFIKRLFVKQPMKFIVCSRNKIVNNRTDSRWEIANRYDIERKMASYGKNFAIQGELIGPKVQGNIYGLADKDFRMFLAYDIDEKRYFSYEEFLNLANELQIIAVPLIEDNHTIITDIKYYVDLSKGNSKLNPKTKREGIVIRLKDENFSFKSINPQYLLGQKDE